MSLKLFLGDEIKVNPSFIVEIYDRVIIKFVSNITAWRNFYKKECTSSIRTTYFEIKPTDTFEFENNISKGKEPYQIYTFNEEK